MEPQTPPQTPPTTTPQPPAPDMPTGPTPPPASTPPTQPMGAGHESKGSRTWMIILGAVIVLAILVYFITK